MQDRLAKEIMDAANNTGAAVKNVKIHTKWRELTVPSLTPLIFVGYVFAFLRLRTSVRGVQKIKRLALGN